MKYLRPTLITVAISSFLLAGILSLLPESHEEIVIKVTPYQGSNSELRTQLNPVSVQTDKVRVHYFVKVGDTLGSILANWNIPYQVTQKILEADLTSLKLDTIKPGDRLELVLDEKTRQLIKLTYHESLVEKAIYTRN